VLCELPSAHKMLATLCSGSPSVEYQGTLTHTIHPQKRAHPKRAPRFSLLRASRSSPRTRLCQ
jgi:hypothetical protein